MSTNKYEIFHMSKLKWTNEKIKYSALQYNTRSEWRKAFAGAYQAAYKKNILIECCAHMKYITNPFKDDIGIIYGYFFNDKSVYIGLTIETLKKRHRRHISNKYHKTIKSKIDQGYTYNLLILEDNIPNGILSEREIFYIQKYKDDNYIILNKHMGGSRGALLKISTESIRISAKKYQSRTEWRQNDPKKYDAAYRRDIIDKCCEHMIPLQNSYNDNDLIEKSKKYNSVKEWKNSDINSYNAAYRKGILESCTTHMVYLHKKWTDEEIINSAKQYTTVNDWRINCKSYNVAHKRKLLSACTEHMKRSCEFKK